MPRNKKMEKNGDVVDVEELLKKHAKKLYRKTNPWYKRIHAKNLDITVDYGRMKRKTLSETFEDTAPDLSKDETMKVESLYSETFNNKTDLDQHISVEEMRETTSVAKVTLKKGITLGLGLDLGIPKAIANQANLSPAFSIAKELQESYEQKHQIQHNLKTSVTVPQGKTVKVMMHVKRYEYSKTFTMTTELSGPVRFIYRDKTDPNRIQYQEGDIAAILQYNAGGPWKIPVEKTKKKSSKEKLKAEVYTQGEVDIRYSVQKETEVKYVTMYGDSDDEIADHRELWVTICEEAGEESREVDRRPPQQAAAQAYRPRGNHSYRNHSYNPDGDQQETIN